VKLWTTGPVEMWISAAAPNLARSWRLRWRPLNGSPGRWPHPATRTGLRRYYGPGAGTDHGTPSLVHAHLPGRRRAVSRSASQPSQAVTPGVGAGGCAPTATRSPTPDTRTCSPLLRPRSPAVPPAPGRAARPAAPLCPRRARPERQGGQPSGVTWHGPDGCAGHWHGQGDIAGYHQVAREFRPTEGSSTGTRGFNG
jgi:hypothetical protein